MRQTARRWYKVGISKYYFPRHEWPKEVGQSHVEVYRILAGSRSHAAILAWEKYGPDLLKRMNPMIPGKRVSVEVNDPGKHRGGLMGRIQPILVYEHPRQTC